MHERFNGKGRRACRLKKEERRSQKKGGCEHKGKKRDVKMEAVWRVGGGIYRLPRSFSLTDRRRSLTDLNASCSLADMAAGDASGKGRSANVRSEYRDAIWSPLSIKTQEPRRQHTGRRADRLMKQNAPSVRACR